VTDDGAEQGLEDCNGTLITSYMWPDGLAADLQTGKAPFMELSSYHAACPVAPHYDAPSRDRELGFNAHRWYAYEP
jgi:hypothetical protein